MKYTPPSLPEELRRAPVPAPKAQCLTLPGPDPLALDLETTGVHPVEDHILEFAALLLTRDLEVVSSFGSRVLHATQEQLGRMDEYVVGMHTASGLLDEVEASTLGVPELEQQVLEWLAAQGYTAPADPRRPGLIVLGNSTRLDLGMIEVKMPRLAGLLSHRMADVSAYRELGSMYNPRLVPGWDAPRPGATAHRSLDDVHASVIEARAQRAKARAQHQPL